VTIENTWQRMLICPQTQLDQTEFAGRRLFFKEFGGITG